MINEHNIQQLIDDVQRSKKYRELALPDAFLHDLIKSEIKQSSSKRAIKENFRKKLHEVIAPYLEDIDYQTETDQLNGLAQTKPEMEAIKAWSREMMQKHASTRERLPQLDSFYTTIWQHIGKPKSIIDLACALDPLALPWFENPSLNTFFAVDIHQSRLTFLSTYFKHFYPFATVLKQDFVAQPIQIQADCAFLFKEAHRMEKRRTGITRQVCQDLNVRHIVISLPATDLKGHHSLQDFHDQLIQRAIDGLEYSLTIDQVGIERLYFIEKP